VQNAPVKPFESKQRVKKRGENEQEPLKEAGQMLMDRYQAEDVFARVPQMAQRIDPVLKKLDQLLEDDVLYRQVRADFSKRHRWTLVHGRPSTPVEVLLRLLIVKHLQQWSYQDTEEQVDQNLILRWFCRLYWAPVPDDTTLIGWANTFSLRRCMPSPTGSCSWRRKPR
jgi:hypothetical protein